MAKKTSLSKAVARTNKPVPVKIVSESPSVARDDDTERRKWKAQDALRTCQEYERIKKDKALMGDVKKLAKEEMKKLESVAKKY
jgi:hypothetical protein